MSLSRAAIVSCMLLVTTCGSAFAAAPSVAEMERILTRFPELNAQDVRSTPIPGLYEIGVGAQVSYVTADGRYMIQGDLFDAETEENLTESRRVAVRLAAIEAVGESSMIVFEPKDVKHTITVFTDIDCGYCRKLHRQIDDYNARGIKVRYMFYPRSGPQTPSWFKAEEVWCAQDHNDALTQAKAGVEVESDDCGVTPVAQHYQLGRNIGIQGTPAIVIDSGEMIPGYVAPKELSEYLDAG
jgi:thiol:disulfide interchange protein DsbC